jgi:hypothetical protein
MVPFLFKYKAVTMQMRQKAERERHFQVSNKRSKRIKLKKYKH